MADVLEAIVAGSRRSASDRAASGRADVERAAASATPDGRAFAASLSPPGVRIIAECKRRSPSKGVLRREYDPVAIAQGYESAGAAAISVLTEPSFFDGSLDHLRAVRAAVRVPLLRKDFIVNEFQIVEARAAGADAVLLIVAALDDRALASLMTSAEQHGLAALVEVHSAEEAKRAIDSGATIVGVNSRDLRTLEVKPEVFDQAARLLPGGTISVAESGISQPVEIRRLKAAGYRAFLMGERFMTTPDPGAALRAFATAPELGQ
ncbi:MAG TPA: indole-3-glycerol phosphate synthase TrpC [Vicinamibacterales bacterium]|nr:indole-3-glycerol phosphate synthase TrpC [Vicinamibacterales bacterium]